MTEKSNRQPGIEIISHSKIIGFAFLLSVFLISCNNTGKSTDKKDSASTSIDIMARQPDTPDTVNWVTYWDPVPFKADPNDNAAIEEEKRAIRVYVRGWLAEYNADDARTDQRKPFVVSRFIFDRVSSSPLAYKVQAFLRPPAIALQGYSIPPSPPPPK